jgi:hypothetical protein
MLISTQKSANTQNDDCLFWAQNLRIVLLADTPISSTGMDEIRYLSIIFLYVIFIIFGLHPSNVKLLQEHLIRATKCPGADDRDTALDRQVPPFLRVTGCMRRRNSFGQHHAERQRMASIEGETPQR